MKLRDLQSGDLFTVEGLAIPTGPYRLNWSYDPVRGKMMYRVRDLVTNSWYRLSKLGLTLETHVTRIEEGSA